MAYLTLENLIDILCVGSKLHICVHDVSGILSIPSLSLPLSYKMHDTAFCMIAKGTAKGLKQCLKNKDAANLKAIKHGVPFDVVCPYGIYEYVYPIKINETVKCILYIGNITKDKGETEDAIASTSEFTRVNSEQLKKHVAETENYVDQERYRLIGQLVENHILTLYSSFKANPIRTQDTHWLVTYMKRDIENYYSCSLSVQDEANRYFTNAKYAGRLFKKETGLAFHEYLNKVRLKHAVQALCNTEQSIITIAEGCGFQNVTYFNRVFKNRYLCSPSEYRCKH